MKGSWLVFLILSLSSPSLSAQARPEPIDFGNYYALLIGINDYQAEGWNDLESPEGDVAALEEILAHDYGFSVETLTGSEATRVNIIGRIRREFRLRGGTDNLLIYFAGHGQLDILNQKKAYWIPVDGDDVDEASWIPHSTIKDLLESRDIETKSVAIITDSCYGGALTRSGRTRGLPDPDDQELYDRELPKLIAMRSRQVLSSGALEPVPDDSAFAGTLRSALRRNERDFIDLENVYWNEIRPVLESAENVSQDPQIARIYPGGNFEAMGQFVLHRVRANDD